MLLVLAAAALHATWNALIKSGQNKFIETVLLVIGAGVVSGIALLFVPRPATASWPFLLASVAIHCVYFSLVAGAYRLGDLSVIYPIMRGTAPALTAVFTGLVLGEAIGRGGWLGIALLCAGILWLARDGLRAAARTAVRAAARDQRQGLIFGLLNALVIVAYTVVDGLGARAAESALSYVLWMFFLNMLAFGTLAFLRRHRAIWAVPVRGWLKGVIAGACSIGSYGIALWAMTQAPIALVAALRETSALFGTLLAALVLHERFGRARWVAAALITSGAVVMKILGN